MGELNCVVRMGSTIELQVAQAGEYHSTGKVPLTTEHMDELDILSGDKVTVIGTTGRLTGTAWPEENGRNEIPLNAQQRETLGAQVSSIVEVVAGDKSGSSESTSSVSRSLEDELDSLDSGNASSGSSSDESSTSEDADDIVGSVSYDDIGGLDSELKDIRQMVELPLQEPEVFTSLNIDPPKGVLMEGPPGTGKTLIAKAISNEVNARFIKINGPEIMSKYAGESEERLRKIFEDARKDGPAIIFFDEIDSLGGERDGESDVENRLVAQLLSLMDGVGTDDDVIVLGATNRVDTLDPALRRSGRFDRELHIGVPNEEAREEILDIHVGDMPLADDVDLPTVASQTSGFVGADLAALSREAALETLQEAIFDGTEIVQTDNMTEGLEVSMREFNRAMSRIEPSALRQVAATQPTVDYDDVGGLTEQKKRLREIVEWPLEYTQLFSETNTDSPTGVLIHGSEGLGKTLLARALAGETGINFIKVSGSEIYDKYVGESEDRITELFDTAEQASPAVIFFDQLEAIAGQQSMGGTDTSERVVSQLLAELDAVRNDPNISVFAAANDVEQIQDRVVSSFEELISLPYPNNDARKEILEIHSNNKPIGEDVYTEWLVKETDGFTGSDINDVVREASLLAIREFTEEYGPQEANENAGDITITRDHFEQSLEKKKDQVLDAS